MVYLATFSQPYLFNHRVQSIQCIEHCTTVRIVAYHRLMCEETVLRMENLGHSTPYIKRLAFDALDIKVYASTDTVEIRGVLPLKSALPTTKRTSGCMLTDN